MNGLHVEAAGHIVGRSGRVAGRRGGGGRPHPWEEARRAWRRWRCRGGSDGGWWKQVCHEGGWKPRSLRWRVEEGGDGGAWKGEAGGGAWKEESSNNAWKEEAGDDAWKREARGDA